MPPIETITRPVRNRISVTVPKEYRAYSFRVVLMPFVAEEPRRLRTVKKIPGLVCKISDEDLLSDDSEAWDNSLDVITADKRFAEYGVKALS